jgi:hypothetical protein
MFRSAEHALQWEHKLTGHYRETAQRIRKAWSGRAIRGRLQNSKQARSSKTAQLCRIGVLNWVCFKNGFTAHHLNSLILL